jgi:hypothetical protein
MDSRETTAGCHWVYICMHCLSFIFGSYQFFLGFITIILMHMSFFPLYKQLGPKFLKEKGLKHVVITTADGALESYPAVSSFIILIDYKLFLRLAALPCTKLFFLAF